MVAAGTSMDHSLGAILFCAAIIGNFAVIVVGVLVTLGVSFYRGRLAAVERSDAAARHDAAFHHLDPVRTSLFELLFMAGATGVVLLGLPVVLAATFRFLLPLLGRAWSP
jgi:hypothetical protein